MFVLHSHTAIGAHVDLGNGILLETQEGKDDVTLQIDKKGLLPSCKRPEKQCNAFSLQLCLSQENVVVYHDAQHSK